MLADWVDNYIGIPWHWRGRSRAGVDCWGLVCMVYADQMDTQLTDHVYEDEQAASQTIEEEQTRWPQVEAPQVGDLGIVRCAHHRADNRYDLGPFHLGIYVGSQQVLHAARELGVILMPSARLRILSWHQAADRA